MAGWVMASKWGKNVQRGSQKSASRRICLKWSRGRLWDCVCGVEKKTPATGLQVLNSKQMMMECCWTCERQTPRGTVIVLSRCPWDDAGLSNLSPCFSLLTLVFPFLSGHTSDSQIADLWLLMPLRDSSGIQPFHQSCRRAQCVRILK